MSKPVLDSNLTYITGERRTVAIRVWDEQNPNTDLSAATATMAVYSMTGTATLTPGAATVTGTTMITVARLWDTSGVLPGCYRAEFVVTFGSIIQNFQAAILVLPMPAPS
jgi:hypothetical protein